jgi:hypothetical protein
VEKGYIFMSEPLDTLIITSKIQIFVTRHANSRFLWMLEYFAKIQHPKNGRARKKREKNEKEIYN